MKAPHSPLRALAVSALAIPIAAVIACAFATFTAPAFAQDFPAKEIEIVVPYGTGGSTDAMARIVGAKVSELLKVAVVVVNKPGASGAIGTMYALATSDGYRVATGGNSNLGPVLGIGQKPPYSLDDFAPVARAVVNPLLIVTKKGRFANLDAMIKEAKEKPDTITFGSWGVKSPGHLYGELLAQTAGIKIRHIAFDGGSKAMLSALGGHTDLAIVTIPTAKSNVKAGQLTALAITGDARDDDLLDVASIKELGLPGAVYVSFDGFVAGAKVPKERLAIIRDAFQKALNDPKVRDELKKAGSDPGYLSAADYDVFLKRNLETLKRIATKAGIED
jgi:tripartite-type tricarboxylate transporter receptor subunit TctC